MSKVTPVRKQYLQIKAQHPDAIVFFRLGDFYETFDEDAEIAARELDLVLTSRPMAKGVRVPMAGVPHHAIEGYIARLIEKGYRVAIAEQVGEVTGRGLVAREVTRVVTPGTVVEPALLDEKRPSYLAAVVVEGGPSATLGAGRAGLAYADITTGEFATTQLDAGEVEQELARLQPRECLVPEKQEAGSRKQEAGSRKQEAGSRKQEAGSRKQEAGRKREAVIQQLASSIQVYTLPRSPSTASNWARLARRCSTTLAWRHWMALAARASRCPSAPPALSSITCARPRRGRWRRSWVSVPIRPPAL